MNLRTRQMVYAIVNGYAFWYGMLNLNKDIWYITAMLIVTFLLVWYNISQSLKTDPPTINMNYTETIKQTDNTINRN